jgi:hypothetical protein
VPARFDARNVRAMDTGTTCKLGLCQPCCQAQLAQTCTESRSVDGSGAIETIGHRLRVLPSDVGDRSRADSELTTAAQAQRGSLRIALQRNSSDFTIVIFFADRTRQQRSAAVTEKSEELIRPRRHSQVLEAIGATAIGAPTQKLRDARDVVGSFGEQTRAQVFQQIFDAGETAAFWKNYSCHETEGLG